MPLRQVGSNTIQGQTLPLQVSHLIPKLAQEGVPLFFAKEGPATKQAQPPIVDPEMQDAMKKKLKKVILQRYVIKMGLKLKSLIKYFAMPKGKEDIQILTMPQQMI